MKISYVILSLCLIAFGLGVLYYCVTFVAANGLVSVFATLAIIPLGIVLPLAGGILCLREQFQNRKK